MASACRAAITKLDSSRTFRAPRTTGNIVGEETTEFFRRLGLSYNVTLAYDHSGFGMRLSYVWRDDFLNNNESGCSRTRSASGDPGEESRLPAQLGLQRKLRGVVRRGEHHRGKAAVVLRLRRCRPTLTNFGKTLISRQFALGMRWKL